MSVTEDQRKKTEHHADERPKRKRFSKDRKLEILKEIDENSGELGLILRREGLYSSQLNEWRFWRKNMGTKVKKKTLANEMARVKRENLQLSAKLERAERIIEIQKKTSEFLNLPPIPV